MGLRTLGGGIALLLALTLLSALLTADDRAPAGQQAGGQADQIARDWPEAPRMAAMDMQHKYGAPTGITPTRLIWENKGPWKEIIVYKQETPHDFPKPHTDMLEQVIEYRVPPEKFSELAKFDGSVIAERTRGTLAARCDKEGLNMLALNLANDVITGKKSVEEARRTYAQTAKEFQAGQKPPLTQRLMFQQQARAGDKDMPAAMTPQPGEPQPAAAQEPARKP